MSLSSVAALLLLVQVTYAFRMQKKNAKADGSSFQIAGVPVYAHDAVAPPVATGLAEVNEHAAEKARYWMLMLNEGVTQSQVDSFCLDCKVECIPEGHAGPGGIPFIEVWGTKENLHELIESHKGMVDFVEADAPTHVIPEVPSDEESEGTVSIAAAASWGLDKVGVSKATNKGRGVHVYVLDTGVRTTHSDFGGRAVPTLEWVSNTPKECRGSTACARDVHGHGTHCAGTVGGTRYGVAPEATLHGVKVLADSGSGSLSWIVGAMDWISTKGQRPAVLSMSLGGPGVSQAYTRAVDAASNNGITVVVASGNDNDDACRFSPAFVPSAITVGSTTSRDARSSFSNYGRCVQIMAPGSDIKSASHQSDTGTATMSGTSMACPHVAGAAALLLEKNRNMNSKQVLSTLLSNAASNKISGVTASCPNKLLYVGGGSSGPSPTPAPAPGTGCTDKNSNCAGWVGAGYCSASSQFHQFMKENCCASCCRDTSNSCAAWRSMGYCSASSQFYQHMQNNCCATCGFGR